jgi:hypothetical protein
MLCRARWIIEMSGVVFVGILACQGKQRPFGSVASDGGTESEVGSLQTNDALPQPGAPLPSTYVEDAGIAVASNCMPGAVGSCGRIYGSKGLCGERVLTCLADGSWPNPDSCGAGLALAEICDVNGSDENCDGRSNEGCPCIPGDTNTCGSVYASVGACANRSIICGPDAEWPELSNCTPVLAEACDSEEIDEDCDGQVNEGCACVFGESSTCLLIHASSGVCAARSLTCAPGGTWPGPEECVAQAAELCRQDAADENCDGRINEAPTCGPFVSLASTWDNACGVSSDGSVWCWGENGQGQLGDGTLTDRPLPTLVPSLSSVVQVVGQAASMCALLGDGTVRCWGQNFDGVLGDGTTVNRLTPVEVLSVADATSITMAGDACALLRNGTVKCWGAAAANGSPVAVELPELSDVESLGIGGMSAHTCAVQAGSGDVYCWGYNFYGQVGDGTTIDRFRQPVKVVGVTGARMVATGSNNTCVVLRDGTARCWGFGYGLGDGVTTNS